MCHCEVRDPRKTKKASHRSKALPVEVERETCDDEHEKLYRDLEQEVKDAEPEKAQKIPNAQSAEAEAKTAAAAQAVATVATAALTAAVDGQTITKNIAEAAEASEASEAREMEGKDQEILALIQERKKTAKHEKGEFVKSSKRSKNGSGKKRKKRRDKFQKILEDVKGTRNILSTKSVKNRILIPKVRNKKAKPSTRDRESQMFSLNSTRACTKVKKMMRKKTESRTGKDERLPDQYNPIPEFTKNEIQNAIGCLKKGKAKDSSGVRAEQLKNCSDSTEEKITMIFNEITRQEDFTPKSRHEIRIQVMYKKKGTNKMQAITGHLQPASTIQTICLSTIRTSRSISAQSTTSRPGMVPAYSSNR